MHKIDKIIIHHSVSDRDSTTVSQINSWHRKRWDYVSKLGYHVGYHVVIGGNYIKQTRMYDEVGAHAYGNNQNSIGICLTGDFTKQQPSQYQLEQLGKLLVGLMDEFELEETDIYRHADFSSTACPGDNLTKSVIRSSLRYGYNPDLTEQTPPEPENKLQQFLDELQNLIKKYR